LIKIKNGVKPANLTIAAALANVAEEEGLTLVITSGTDGSHMNGSKHYTGEALDVRISNLSKAEIVLVMSLIRKRLGSDYDVILEKDHIHLEFDPLSVLK
jgi:hypothetical protein